jgi:hypothetical protein
MRSSICRSDSIEVINRRFIFVDVCMCMCCVRRKAIYGVESKVIQ